MLRTIAVAAFLASGGVAQAADAIVEEVPVEAGFSWTGGYLGGQGGFAWSDVDVTEASAFFPPVSFDADGGFVGVHGGFNYQTGSMVFGIEADANKSWIDEDFAIGPVVANGELDWFGSVRGRLGYAMGRTLLFGTAGVAFASANASVLTFEQDLNYTGWTAGLGAEHAITDNLTLRAEYRYYDFGDDNFTAIPGINANSEITMSTVLVGASLKF